MIPDLCRGVAFEAKARGAWVNPHELWVALEEAAELQPRLIVDIGSDEHVLWAWWMLGADVIGLASDRSASALPTSIVRLQGDPRDRSAALRVRDQVGRRPVDVLVLAAGNEVVDEQECRAMFAAYAPMVRDGGVVMVRGIADPRTPGVERFWSGLTPDGRRELVSGTDPSGFGVVEIHGKDREQHG